MKTTTESQPITPFNHELFGEIRTLIIDGKPYFVAKDIAIALGYTNSRKAIGDHCKGVTKRYLFTTTGKKSLSMIPEGDVIRLVMRSKLPAAERFEKWVCDEVIPTVLRTGSYTVPRPVDFNARARFPVNLFHIYTALKIEKAFAEWITFISQVVDEGVDYMVIGPDEVRGTFEMARHAALSADSMAGGALRRYFIDVEKEWDGGGALFDTARPGNAIGETTIPEIILQKTKEFQIGRDGTPSDFAMLIKLHQEMSPPQPSDDPLVRWLLSMVQDMTALGQRRIKRTLRDLLREIPPLPKTINNRAVALGQRMRKLSQHTYPYDSGHCVRVYPERDRYNRHWVVEVIPNM